MNYQRHYDLLIARAQHRAKPSCATEKHHIVPRCMGGGNDTHNIAVLTVREHYLAHILLVKLYPSHKGLIWAVRFVAHSKRMGSYEYSWMKERARVAISTRWKGGKHSAATRAKIGRKIKSAEHIAAIKKAHTGKVVSAETRAKIGAKSRQRITTPQGSINLSIGHSGEKNGRHGKRTMNNGTENRIVPQCEISNMLMQGWCLGITAEKCASILEKRMNTKQKG